MSREKDEPVY